MTDKAIKTITIETDDEPNVGLFSNHFTITFEGDGLYWDELYEIEAVKVLLEKFTEELYCFGVKRCKFDDETEASIARMTKEKAIFASYKDLYNIE